MTSRRGIMRRLAAAAGSVGLAGCEQITGVTAQESTHQLGENPNADRLPERQHAWEATLDRDEHGNPLPPRHHRLLFLTLDVDVTDETTNIEAANSVERAMRTLESAFEWSPRGLLHGLAWGTRYFERLNALDDAPIEEPRVLSRTDDPDLLAFDAALVLASDVPRNLSAATAAMFGSRSTLGDAAVESRLGDVFTVAAKRTGFVGEGLPAAHSAAEGVPSDGPPEDAPLFTGFFSGRQKTQASESAVTIPKGKYAGGTTMHVSHLRESLDDWWNTLDAEDRTARMFGADVSPSDVASFTDDVQPPADVEANAREYGVVGHQEKVARAREDGEPLILRRDFNTVHDGRASLVFVSLQQSLADFRKTRRAMNGWYLRDDHDDITDRKNNGILDFITVKSRANFYLPPRKIRAFPE